MLQNNLVTPGQPDCRKSVEFQLVLPLVEIFFKIDKAQYFPWFAVDLVLLFEREQQYPLATDKLGVNDVGKVDIEMHMRHGALTAYEQHRVAFDKTLHQMLRPDKIIRDLRGMFENIKEKNAPFRGTSTNHIDIIPEFHI